MKKIFTIVFLLIGVLNSQASDNYIKSYIKLGHSPSNPFYGGTAFIGDGRVCNHLRIKGGLDLSSNYSKAGFGAVMLGADVDFKTKRFRWVIRNKFAYSYFGKYQTHEMGYNINLLWETNFVDVSLGNTFRFYGVSQEINNEPVNFFCELTVRARPLHNPWNIFFKFFNYDDFDMGRMHEFKFSLGGHYDINSRWRVGAEYVVAPQGNQNNLAQWYSSYGKVYVLFKL